MYMMMMDGQAGEPQGMSIEDLDLGPAGPTYCYLDVRVGGTEVARMIFELYTDDVPKAVENFRSLCTGERGVGKRTGRMLHYANCPFHWIHKGSMCRSGDIERGDGRGGESIFGGTFEDEEEGLCKNHDARVKLSMVNE